MSSRDFVQDDVGQITNKMVISLKNKASEIIDLANFLYLDDKKSNVGEKSCHQSASFTLAKYNDELILAKYAKELIEARKVRERFLPAKVLGEPVWNMLLDLFVNFVDGRRVAISSLCIASEVPSTTALRYIGLMEDHDMVSRKPSLEDQRVVYIEMTPNTLGNMKDCLRCQLRCQCGDDKCR